MAYLYDLTDTWNAAGTVFNAIKMNVTNSASAAGSKIVSLQVGSTDRFTVDKDGNGYFSGTLQAVGAISFPNAYLSGNSGTIGMQDNSASILAYNSTGSGGITNTLRFITGSAERMRVDGSGNVGIGTSSPSAKLTVSGSGDVAQFTNGTRSAYIALDSSGFNMFTGAGQTGNGIYASAASNYTALYTASSERMRIDSSGNVGIGTSSPGAKLHVLGSEIRLQNTGGFYSFYDTAGTTRVGYIQNATGNIAIVNEQAGYVNFYTSNTERVRIDSSGNLGLGVTPSAWSATARAFEFGPYGALYQNASGYPELAFNTYVNTSNNYTYRSTDVASRYLQYNGQHQWFNAPSGTAGNAISFTQAMTLDASGRLLVGTTTAIGALTVESSTATTTVLRNPSASGYTSLRLYNDQNSGSRALEIDYFGSTASGGERAEITTTGAYPLLFLTSNTERMRILSSGEVLIGRSGTSGYGKLNVEGGADFTGGNVLLCRDTGNVGIGTSSPGAKLETSVTSNGATAEVLRLSNPGAGANTQAQINFFTASTSYATITGGYGASAPQLTFNLPSVSAGNYIWQISGSEKMRLDSSGNVGIGTSSPGQKLTLQGAQLTIPAAGWSSGQVAYNYLGDTNGGIRATNGGNVGVFAYNGFDVTVNGVTPITAMTITSAGNVGIGTSSPGYKLVVNGGDFLVSRGSGATAADAAISFGGNANNYIFSGNSSNIMAFATNGSERARIDGSGNLLVGTSSVNGTGWTVNPNGSGQIRSTGTGSEDKIQFANGNGVVGAITTNGTATAYNTSSDYRLKTVDGPIQNSGAYIDALKPVQGSWKADGSRFIGLIAHEVQEVSETQIATGVKDGEEMQAMDYSAPELIANLIAEIQSLRARVAQLEGN